MEGGRERGGLKEIALACVRAYECVYITLCETSDVVWRVFGGMQQHLQHGNHSSYHPDLVPEPPSSHHGAPCVSPFRHPTAPSPLPPAWAVFVVWWCCQASTSGVCHSG